MVSLKLSGISHWERDRLMILVVIGNRTVKQSFRRHVGIGPRLQDFVELPFLIFSISASDTGWITDIKYDTIRETSYFLDMISSSRGEDIFEDTSHFLDVISFSDEINTVEDTSHLLYMISSLVEIDTITE